jgi:hypothetical protein
MKPGIETFIDNERFSVVKVHGNDKCLRGSFFFLEGSKVTHDKVRHYGWSIMVEEAVMAVFRQGNVNINT